MRRATFVLIVFLASFVCAVDPRAQSVPVSDAPPRASLIQLATPDANHVTRVTGLPGAVLGNSAVVIVTLDTNHFVTAQAAPDGSFSQTIFAPAGTSLLLKMDPTGRSAARLVASDGKESGVLEHLPGTIIRVAERPAAGPGAPFGGAGPTRATEGNALPAVWTLEGTINATQLEPGSALGMTGTLVVKSPALSTAGAMRVRTHLGLERLSEPDGAGSSARNSYSSVFMTPTGLPIERMGLHPPPAQFTEAALPRVGADLARLSLALSLTLPSDLASGYYRPFLIFDFEGVPLEQVRYPFFGGVDKAARRPRNGLGVPTSVYLPIVRVGRPAAPRLFWTLLADTLSNGTRGVRASEDRNRFGLAARTLTPSETFVVPRLDPATGRPVVYRLEPFAPTLALSAGGTSVNPPLIPLRFPSGALTVSVRRPDGTTVVLGPAPFAQARTRGIQDRHGLLTGNGDINTYELSTMDPRFELSFPRDGRYLITLDGWVEDIWGTRWSGGGSYEVFVASPLSLDTTALPGAPFEVGDTLAPGVVITPPVAAEVDARVRFAPDSDPARLIDRTIRGRANRFGYFSPAGQGVRFDQPGEYRVDLKASFIDAQGNWRMDSRTWSGVVAARAPAIIAHGRRGVIHQSANRAQWFFRSQTGVPVGGSAVNYPFHSGDVVWAQQSDAVDPKMTFQDPLGAIRNILWPQWWYDEPGAAIGEAALTSFSTSGPSDPLLHPSRVDVWGYSYRSVQRPLARVREIIAEEWVPGTYWVFLDRYGGQVGTVSGDLPNDIKFQYGGVVLRGPVFPAPAYAIYGSLFVLVPDNDPGGGSRVFPPFQGNGGGPSGGPVMKLKGQDIDLFIHLTGVRPGTVLEPGDNFSIAGAIGPTLPALVATTVTTPSGRTIQFSGRANRVGYYYRPEHDFAVQEPGLYTVDVRVTFDGQTSAGRVSAPFPAGDVLGSANGRFFVYVVPRESAPLAVNLPETAIIAPPGQLDIAASAPAGLSLTSGHVTTMMPGFLLQTNQGAASAGSLSYRYDPATLARDFPNLDLNPPADVITISLFGQTTDSEGRVSYAARVLVLHGQELLNPTLTRAVGSVASVSAASFSGTTLANESIVAAFGAGLATATQTAATVPLPTSLAGTTITVKDSAGVERPAPIFFVSPNQVNYQIPPETMAGLATMTIAGGAGTISTGAAQIATVAPGLFTANANGQGVAAAVALRIKADGTQSFEPVARFDAATNRFVSAPIDLGPASDQVFLILFGTGFRFANSPSAATATIGGANAEVLFAGEAPGFVGMDQANVRLSRSLIGRGEVDVVLVADGKMANTVRVNIK